MEKVDGMVIIDHYKTLDAEQKSIFRDEVLRITGIKYSSFYNKISGRCKFTNSEIIVISHIIDKQYVKQD